MKIGNSELHEIISVIENKLSRMMAILGEGNCNSDAGYMVIADAKDGRPILLVRIGDVPPTSRSNKLAPEKAFRLSCNDNHESSWESRNPEGDKYGGAIRVAGGYIFSFSGLPELADEALMLITALELNFLTEEDVQRIAEISGNPFILKPWWLT